MDYTVFYRSVPMFDKIFTEKVKRYSACSRYDLLALYHYVIYSNYQDGHVAEAGVFRGGAAYLIAAASHPSKEVHLFDSFEGLPDPSLDDTVENDPKAKGRFHCEVGFVKEMLLPFGSRIKFHRGYFTNTFNRPTVADTQYSLVHIDVDLYESARDCLNYFHPRMVKGGVIVFHDYKFRLTPGATKAMHEHFGGDVEELPLKTYRSATQIAIFV